ncbi:MAG: RadC family protein [Clostridia bacterium]|nr:RadC family protein [Clostridia bacterium]
MEARNDQNTENISPEVSDNKGIHDGHRQRIRARFSKEGIDHFAEHEVLELALMQIIKRGDVNPVGHRLLDHFGSLAAVFDADEEELCKINGIGEQTAFFLHLLPQLFKRYALDKCNIVGTYDNIGKISDYLHALYTGVVHERVYLLLFDNAMRLIDTYKISDGSVNCAAITVRKIVELALTKHAAGVVLAHNHPRGLPIASGNDLEVTRNIDSALSTVAIPLIEHIIVTENSYAAIVRSQKGMLRASPVTGLIDEGFYKSFYLD